MFAILKRVTRKVLNKKMTLEPRFKSSGELNPAFVGAKVLRWEYVQYV